MLDTSDDTTMTAHEIGNLRFLIEHQLDVMATLERQGLDLQAASDLLARLMRRDEELRLRVECPSERVVIAFREIEHDVTPKPGPTFWHHALGGRVCGREAASPIRCRPVAPAV